MTIYATAGSKLYIGGVLAMKSTDFVESDFTSQVWTEIGGLEGLGKLGDTSEAISVKLVGESRTKKLKGTRDAGTMEIVAALDASDTGQLAAITAEKSKDSYAFKLVLNDAPAGGTPSERKFIALVMSAEEQFDQANNEMKLNISLAVNSNVVRTEAAEAVGG
ncbi:conserved hypothetical protein [uncultured Pleomorphomonas sp.]|uniref:Phage tail protein n=1 Tax=uncultured Pleomorphomonas sp. TaxID=442121 RepID=A0A212LC90_9HYPH|nr:hypothetical protein [uncultured Pleomorphomonas sp.]SCM70039.1 conserved hypothetical protein [uncultured Pleomorphomonas sp.]SCM75120.1 conserved hypothetical protein [uncultured Pleomorphomonas sp.]